VIDRPILIVSAPRSGSTLLFEQLARAPGLFTTGSESHKRIEQIGDFAPRKRDWGSNRLTADDATQANSAELTRSFHENARDRDGKRADGPVRILEKTPKNALRVPFLAQAWPDSLFVYLHRKARPSVASMIEGWVSGRFRTYPMLPGWPGYPWSFILVPGWRELAGRPLPEIVARQWAATTEILIDDLSMLAPDRVSTVDYDRFVADPQRTLANLAGSLGLGWDQELDRTLPLSRFTVTPPADDKWRRIEHLIAPVAPLFEAAEQRAADFLASRA
jgi:hypothetical protein